ncbi:MAG: low molecular weight protein arginine phosphatase, partial [Clostridiales bacterium]|nr:low molecular weight protein arginine phosphatase [Clostridiales bacterium]
MILFVCTGNTCRSPLAAALARARGTDAESAGL